MERLLATGALAVVLSVALTVIVGFGLLNLPWGFAASWSDPTLEIVLAVLTVVGAVVAGARGAYRRTPPDGPVEEPSSGEDDAWEAIRRLEALHREERRLRHQLRTGPSGPRSAEFEARLQQVREEIRAVGERQGGRVVD